VSADSRQIYRETAIGTAAPTAAELAKVPHHFIGSHSIHQPFSAGRFAMDARQCIDKLFTRHQYVVLCGGSGLYIKAVCEGFDDIPQVTESVRQNIIHQYNTNGLAWLQAQVAAADPTYYARVDRQNPQRLMRALEIFIQSGIPLSQWQSRKAKASLPFALVKVGLEVARDELYQRIDSRVEAMIAAGLFEEAEQLYPLRHLNALQTVGYQEIFGFLEEKYDRQEAVRLLKRNTRHYAKRQLTWFKKDEQFRWFHPREWAAMINFAEDGSK